MNKLKVIKNFTYLIVNEIEAFKIFDNNIFELYELHQDDSESLIETRKCIEIALRNGNKIGIEAANI